MTKARSLMPLLLAALAGSGALAACSDDTTTGVRKTGDVGRVRFVNATPDSAVARSLGMLVDGAPVGAGLAYGGASAYLPAYLGTHHVVGVRSDTTIATVPFDGTVDVAKPADYTVLATGKGTDRSLLVLSDTNTAPAADKAVVRIVNAAPSAPSVDVYVTTATADLLTATPIATAIPFRGVTKYVTVGTGVSRIRLTTAGTKTVVLDVSTAALVAGQIRTLVALDKTGGGTPLTSATLTDRNP